MRAFPLPSGERLAQLLYVGPGVMAGDDLALEVEVGPGAAALLVAQSATKIHAMRAPGAAHQAIRFRVAAGASLEYHPGLSIPFAHSDFSQRIEVDLAAGARFVMLERWAAGRVARGERHAYRRVASSLRVRSAGELVYADALALEPHLAAGPSVFDGRAYLASALRVGGADLSEPPNAAEAGVELGSYRSGRAWIVRALADDGAALQRSLVHLWRSWRHADDLPAVALERFGS